MLEEVISTAGSNHMNCYDNFSSPLSNVFKLHAIKWVIYIYAITVMQYITVDQLCLLKENHNHLQKVL